MKWLLIVYVFGYNAEALTTERFLTNDACHYAGERIESFVMEENKDSRNKIYARHECIILTEK